MSVHAGTILHLGGNNVIDRIQSAGLGDVRVTNDVIREVGNEKVVDKVPQDPDFTFNLETLDVSTEIEAWLSGQVASGPAPENAPGAADAAGTEYKWGSISARAVNIPSPWKDALSGEAGNVAAGHLIPGYYPNRLRYRFGLNDNAVQEVELGGGAFYYADAAPVEQFEVGDGAQVAFPTDDPAVMHRRGGASGTSFKAIFGVIVDGVLQTEGVDYTQAPAGAAAAAVATVTFTTAPANGAVIRFCYFTTAAQAFPQARHASTVVKPGSVRGRNICIYLGTGGARQKLGSVQSFELEATVDAAVEREFCNEEIVGRTVNGRDVTGNFVVRSKNPDAFIDVLAKVTGVARAEVHGFLNTNQIPLEVQIQNPKNPAQILKTLYVSDAIVQPPGTPARVNAPTDFTFGWESATGDYSAFKGARP